MLIKAESHAFISRKVLVTRRDAMRLDAVLDGFPGALTLRFALVVVVAVMVVKVVVITMVEAVCCYCNPSFCIFFLS